MVPLTLILTVWLPILFVLVTDLVIICLVSDDVQPLLPLVLLTIAEYVAEKDPSDSDVSQVICSLKIL